jgi:endonuclease/exonuclease/phosphatase family metal-dependent hydrolase
MRKLLLASMTLGLVSCEWVADGMSFTREEIPVYKERAASAEPAANPTRLKVMAWNIKYGACRIDFWFDFWGDRAQMSTTEVTDCLSKVAALIEQYNPDILMTEEIEVDSRRSAYVDMVRFLLENTSLRFAAFGETWNTRYAPQEGVGRITLGNAIFSRYPIVKAERIRQEDRTDQSVLVKTFYIHRAITRIEVDVGNSKRVAAYAVHTEAYDNDGTKQKQIKQIHDLMTAETLPFVVGGDFNELPPVCDEKAAAGSADSCDGKLQLKGFLDERASSVGTDYAQPPYTPSVMKVFYDDFKPSITLARYGVTLADHQPYFTHSVLGPDGKNDDQVSGNWNRTLDYLFIRKTEAWEAGSTDVIQGPGRLGVTADALRLSDHAPTAGTWVLP